MPDFSSRGGQRQVATGTDGKPDNQAKSAYKPDYKKLAKNAYSGLQQSSMNGTEEGRNIRTDAVSSKDCKVFERAELGTK